MNIRVTLRSLGGLFMLFSGTMLVPLIISAIYHDWFAKDFIYSAGITFSVGYIFYRFIGSRGQELNYREAFGIVSFGWLGLGLFGALPFYFSGSIPSFTDAFFESISGFTTTGSTILKDITILSETQLFWRSLIQWIGGMGIIVLSVAILPLLEVGGMQLFSAEAPGPTSDKLTSRIQDTAKVLWGIYFGLTFLLFISLVFAGMNVFESICHAFTTMATGGFSTRNGSIAEFQNPKIEYVIIVFMLLAGTNFSLHYWALRGRIRDYFRHQEFLTYLGFAVLGTVLVVLLNWNIYSDQTFEKLFRDALFQVVTIGTTTGFGSADYELWHSGAQLILVMLMVSGGCAGSTSGGLKVIRILLIIKQMFNQIFTFVHPKAVRKVMMDGTGVPQPVINAVASLLAIYVMTFFVGSLFMSALGLDFLSAGGAVLACLGNIGPGLGSVGPTDNFSHIPAIGKWVLSICMIIGRLEFYTVIVLFLPSFWRR